MALTDEFQARYTKQEIIELTNKDAPTATTINTTFLDLAVADVEAEFEIQGVGEYDNDNALHVGVAVEGVRSRLKTLSRTGGIGGAKSDEWNSWIEDRCGALAKVTGRKRVDANTSTETTPSDELPAGISIRRPWADYKRFRDFQVNKPYGVGDDDRNED